MIIGNRDEFADRPSAPIDFWASSPQLLAGRDLLAGGTWFGVTREGRVGLVTNFREVSPRLPETPSRGELVAGYLRLQRNPVEFLSELQKTAQLYSGFNLILGTFADLYYYSNRSNGDILALVPGIYGLSNSLLDVPWWKVTRIKEEFSKLLQSNAIDDESIFSLLADATPAPDDVLPNTGVGPYWEKILSPIFVKTSGYHTRASYMLAVNHQGRARVVERNFDPEGKIISNGEFFF